MISLLVGAKEGGISGWKKCTSSGFSCGIDPDWLPAKRSATRYFSDFCKKSYRELKGRQANLLKQATNYETFTAPKDANGRRNFALVHPLSQLALSLVLTQNRNKIRKIISENGHSLYRTTEDISNLKAFEGLDFRRRDTLTARYCSQNRYILQADISRCFYTIYTHSISWAVVGKEKVKEWLFRSPARLRNHWTSQLDKALQSCQSRETFGIPVGPDTSRIIAEIILAGIEKKKDFASAIQGRDRFRLVDDFFIGFDDESSSVHALNALRRALWDFNLQLNEEKTKTKQSKEIFRDKWKHDFETLHIDISDDGKQEKDIHRLVDVTLAACIEARTSAPTGWACRRLARLQHTQNNFGLVLEALFRLSRDYPYCTSHVAEFLINKQHLCNDIALRPKIEAWIKSTLRLHFEHDHHFELTWTLLACGVLRIKLDEEDLRPFDKKINSAVFALLGLLRERGLLAVPLSKWSWRSQVKSRGIHGENWLPYYEAVRRKWTKDKDMIAAVKKDAVLSKMLTEGVTFLEDRILDAGRINITRRTFRPTTSHPHEKPTENRGRTPRNRLPSASDATVLRRIDHPEFDEDFDNELYGDPADVFELDFDDDDY